MKYIAMIGVLFLFALPVTVSAHTHLESSDPQSGGAITSENPGVTLTFDSKVQEPTALTVTGEGGEGFDIDTYTHSPENVIEFNLPAELKTGDIEVFYSIIGEDGHVMENQLTFTYTAKEGTAESETEDPVTTSDEDESTAGEGSADEQAIAADQSNESSVWIVPVLGFGLLITAGLVFFGVVRKKS